MSASDTAKELIPKKSKTMNWNGETNGLLLRFILASHEIKVNFGVVAKLLGPNCTARAVKEQVRKLKKIGLEEAAAADAAAAAGTGMVAASPRKRAEAAASKEPKKRKTMKAEPKEESRERIKEEVEESDKDDESVLPSPAKRPRTHIDIDENGHGGENGLLAELW